MNRFNIVERLFSGKRTLLGALFCVQAFILPSCTSIEDTNDASGSVPDGYLHIEFTAPATRADIGTDGSGSFTDGDVVGLYVTGDNGTSYHELTYGGGEWLPRLRRDEFGDGALVLSAHFPAAGEEQDPENHVLDIALDQSGDVLSKTDLLFSQSEIEPGEYRAVMTFRHALHRISISFTGAESDPEVKVRSVVEGKVNLLTGRTEATGTGFKWIVPGKDNAGNCLALVIPQSAIPYRDGDGLLNITVDGKNLTYNAPEKTEEGADLVFFESGKQTSVNLSLRPGNPELAGKSLWVKGLNVPDFPGKDKITTYPFAKTHGLPAGEWGRLDYTFQETQFLTWKEGCGWYDCNKSYRYTENDGNLCWAASASSLILWWLNSNIDYIRAYDEKYGSSVNTAVGVIERPSHEFLPLYPDGVINDTPIGPVNRAPVFEFFKTHFNNIGNSSEFAINWFVCGAQLGAISGFRGFFSEVFDTSDRLAVKSVNQPDMEAFNEFITDALLDGKAIGFSINDIAGSGTGNHALALWGVEYDDSGLVSHIYYCDNNEADQDPNGAAISRIAVVYRESGGRTYTYVRGLEPEKPEWEQKENLLVGLISVDLGRDRWKQKFPDVSAE